MSKPASSIQVSRDSLKPLGPAYGFREGSGSSTADDAGVGPAGSFQGGAAWASTANGPVVRLTANGDWIAIPWNGFDNDFETNTTAVTLLLGVTPTSFPGRPGQQASFFHRQYGPEGSIFGIWNVGSDAHPGLIEGRLFAASSGGFLTTPNGLELTAGTAYILVLRCQQNAPLRLRVYNRSTGQQIGSELVGTAPAGNGRITASGINSPFLIGGYTAGSPGQYMRTIPGDYEFFFFSPTYLTDAQVDTFVANPFANYSSSNGTSGGGGSSGSGSGSGSGGGESVTPPPPFDWLAAFELTMQWSATGQAHAYPQSPTYAANADDHYDPIQVFEQVRGYTESSSWDTQIAAAVDHYREQGVFAGGGCVQGYHAYADGLLAHYERTGDTKSRDAAILVSQNAAGSSDATPVTNYLEQAGSREVAFSIETKLAAEALGCAHRSRLEVQVAAALGHIAQWTAPAGSRLWMTFTRPFMVGLTCEALIKYWDRYRSEPDTGAGSIGNLAAQIPAAIKSACDWLWTNTWHGDSYPDDSGSTWSYGGFQYTAEDLRTKFDPVPSTVTGATSGIKFRGDNSLSIQDDFYKYAPIQFTSGTLSGQTLTCSGYTGSTREFRFDYGDSFSGTPSAGDAFQVVYTAYPPTNGTATIGPATGQSGDTLLSPSLNPLIAPMYAWYYWYTASVLGTADTSYRDKFVAAMSGSYTLRVAPYSQKVYNQTYKWAIQGLRWYQRAISEYPAATTLTLTAPNTAGRVNAMSDRFVVALAGSSVSVPTTIKVTPSDGGAGGKFFPAVVYLTTTRSKATFRYRPSSTGAKSISVISSPALANPAAVSYTPSGMAPVASAITAALAKTSGPKGEPVGLNLALSPPSSVAPSTADPQGGLISIFLDIAPGGTVGYSGQGTMSPPLGGWISSDNPVLAMTFTPTDQSPIVINYYGDGSLSNPPASSFKIAESSVMIPPRILAATTEETGTLLTLDFSTPVTGGMGFTLSGGHSLNVQSGSGQSQTYQIMPVVLRNEVLTLAYSLGDIVDASNADNRLDELSEVAVVNHSIIQKTPSHKCPLIIPRYRLRTRPVRGSQ